MIAPELAAFLEGGVSIYIATRNRDLDPGGARVAAVKVDPDGGHITAYIPKAAAGAVVADLRANRQLALGFARPSDDRACQIKGEFVQARAAARREQRFVAGQWRAFVAELEQIGIPGKVTEGWKTWPATAIRVRVTALFTQTPGPGAGAPIP